MDALTLLFPLVEIATAADKEGGGNTLQALNNAGIIALIGTVTGGVGVKFVERWLSRAQTRQAGEANMRDELRKEVDSLRAQLNEAREEERRLEALVDDWQGKYYDLRDEKQQAVTELKIMAERLRLLEKPPVV